MTDNAQCARQLQQLLDARQQRAIHYNNRSASCRGGTFEERGEMKKTRSAATGGDVADIFLIDSAAFLPAGIFVARAAGYLKDFPPTVDFDEAMRLPRDKLMVIATGGQGEARAALGRWPFPQPCSYRQRPSPHR